MRTCFALSLLVPLALLVASCNSGSDSTSSAETVAPQANTSTTTRPTTTIADLSTTTTSLPALSPTTTPPISTTALPANRVTAITAGSGHSCALHQDGTISCWGSNEQGQLGNGTSGEDADSAVPVRVNGITDATAIAIADAHSCALHQDGTITCWGNNEQGQLGNGTSGEDADSAVPVRVNGITDATAIAIADAHSCALHQDGTITCWGNNWNGQLGNGAKSYFSSLPVGVGGITDATAITAGFDHSCALHQTGAVSCWGANSDGQLGNGQSREDADSSVPVRVNGITDATAITAGGNQFNSHSCALHQTGAVSCWGANDAGQLGNGQSGEDADSSVPVRVDGITDATAITAGFQHSCALHQDGTISCWGHNQYGQLGNGTTLDSSVPVGVLGITDATAITAGGNLNSHSCALHQTGAISCWGNNQLGQSTGKLTNDSADSSVPVGVNGIADAAAITAGWDHSCALHQTGTVTCWGGWGASSFVPPLEVEGISDATAITAGLGHSCALHETGTVSCWGVNGAGQLGNGVWLPQFVVGFGG